MHVPRVHTHTLVRAMACTFGSLTENDMEYEVELHNMRWMQVHCTKTCTKMWCIKNKIKMIELKMLLGGGSFEVRISFPSVTITESFKVEMFQIMRFWPIIWKCSTRAFTQVKQYFDGKRLGNDTDFAFLIDSSVIFRLTCTKTHSAIFSIAVVTGAEHADFRMKLNSSRHLITLAHMC